MIVKAGVVAETVIDVALSRLFKVRTWPLLEDPLIIYNTAVKFYNLHSTVSPQERAPLLVLLLIKTH